MKTLLFITIYVLSITSSLAQREQDSSLGARCSTPGYSCGECETPLQDDFNALLNKVTGDQFGTSEHWGDSRDKKDLSNVPLKEQNMDVVLKDIIDIFKKNNKAGDNRLNYLVIGESESLQASSMKDGKMNPRIMLKSPNSELMVTFNTDPTAKGYKTIEIMRWNGKQGRYEFQELNFGEGGEKPHLDGSGKKCLECHKSPSPRPNWDTYRAWAGIVPSRDDMLEAKTDENGELKPETGMQPDARAYLGFLDRIAEEKDGQKTGSRLGILDIPFDDKIQLAQYVKDAKAPLTNKEKVDLIKRNINEKGFYRVKHFPDLDEDQDDEKMSFNFDQKTAQHAGPSQFAFDQMLAQNMCKVATDLKKNPNFDKFKYPLAHLIKCGGGTDQFYPPEFKAQVVDHFKSTKYNTLNDIGTARKPAANADLTFENLEKIVNEDTRKNHGSTNLYKYGKHEKFLRGYLNQVEKVPLTLAAKDAKYFSEKVVTPEQDTFHAISDPGGVAGVAEGSTDEIANLRILLEPFNVDVAHWSLVHGKDNAYNSYSFSDQFVQFEQQKLFDDILKEAGSCEELEKRIPASLVPQSKKAKIAPYKVTSGLIESIESACQLANSSELSPFPVAKASEMLAPVLALAKPRIQKMLAKCLTCHDDSGGMTSFDGLETFVKSDPTDASPESYKELGAYMNKFTMTPNLQNIEKFQYKLGVHANNPYGMEMPPSDWSDNQQYAEENGLDPLNVQNIRRKELAMWLTVTAAQSSDSKLKKLCYQLNSDTAVKDQITDPGNRENPKAKQE